MFKFFLFFVFAFSSNFLKGEDMEEPKAKKIEYIIEKHNDKRIDYYYWLKERDSKEVLDYLKKENEYAEYILKDSQKMRNKIYKELKSKIKESYSTALTKYKDYFYYAKYLKGKEYPVYYRKNVKSGKTEKILDVNLMARRKEFCHVTSLKVSPDQNLLAYAADFIGRRFYTIYLKDLKTGKMMEEKIENATHNFVWGADSKTIYYVKQDSETLRWDSLFSYDILKKNSVEVYREKDETFSIEISKSNTERYLFLNITSTLNNEVRYLDLSQKEAEFKIFKPRETELEYSVEDGEDVFYVLHNKNAKNFKLSYVDKNLDFSKIENWKELIAHKDDVLIENFEVFKNRLVVQERKNGVVMFKVLNRDNGDIKYINFKDEVYSASFGENLEYETDYFRYYYESMVIPPTVYDYSFKTGDSLLVKRKEVPNYDPSLYETKRLWVDSRDGTKIPVSIVYKKDKKDKVYVYGYGSYGYSLDADFNSSIFPLVDRGFVYAIVHVRGGSELGRKWYEDGRKLKKKNTFYDFIDVSENLKKTYSTTGILVAEGGSAGGLLMGAIANMSDLYTAIIAEVPFVDCLTTMLDPTIPLTTSEYDEWGNPNIKEYYDYIKSYSPYDNVYKKCYPNMLVTSGYYDSQVQYWEPAKWVAKLREHNTCRDNLIILKTDMRSGHGGKTGRYEYLKDLAFNYSFVLKVSDIKD